RRATPSVEDKRVAVKVARELTAAPDGAADIVLDQPLPVTEFHDPDIIALPDLSPGAKRGGGYRFHGLGVLKAVLIGSACALFIVMGAWGISITAFLFGRRIGAVSSDGACGGDHHPRCHEQRSDTG